MTQATSPVHSGTNLARFFQTTSPETLTQKAIEQNFLGGTLKLKIIDFAATVLKTFGIRYWAGISSKFRDRKIKEIATDTARVLACIQNKLSQGGVSSSDAEIAEFIAKYVPESANPQEFFTLLKQYSYDMMPRSQLILLHRNSNLKELQRIEEVKARMFAFLEGALALDRKEEQKEDRKEPPLSPLENELDRIQFYYNRGLYSEVVKVAPQPGGNKSRSVFLSDLIRPWGELSPRHAEVANKFCQQLQCEAWTESAGPPIGTVSNLNESFPSYLLRLSLDRVMSNLNIPSPSPLRDILSRACSEDGTISADLSYFTANLETLLETDFSQYQRPSIPYLIAIQRLLFLERSYQTNESMRTPLLLMQLYRKRSWPCEFLEGFSQRNWSVQPDLNKKGCFQEAWEGFRTVLSKIHQKEMFVGPLSEEEIKYLEQPEAWGLFHFFLTNPHRKKLIALFSRLAEHPNFALTLENAYTSCANAELYQAIQRLFSLEQSYQVSESKWAPLLQMLIARQRHWECEFPEEVSQESGNVQPGQEKEDSFKEAWKGFQTVLSKIHKKDVSLESLSQKEEEWLKKPEAWGLFHFFLMSPSRKEFILLFTTLAEHPSFTIKLKDAYEFCKLNRDVDNQTLRSFLKTYLLAANYLMDKEIKCQAEMLFFSPPTKIDLGSLPQVMPRIESFTSFLHPQNFESPQHLYMVMLYKHLVDPSDHLFPLIQDAKRIGIRQAEILWEFLSVTQKPFPAELSRVHREIAQDHALSVQRRHQFSDRQLFSVYLEFVRLAALNQIDLIHEMSHFISQIESFFTGVRKEIAYWIYLHHPKINFERFRFFKEKREEWARVPDLAAYFIKHAEELQHIGEELKSYADLLATNFGEDQGLFAVAFGKMMYDGFFPPAQCIGDFLRITDVTQEDIQWQNPHLKTHKQIKSIGDQAKLGVYFDWFLLGSIPHLSYSFFNKETGQAVSSTQPLALPKEMVADPDARNKFYSALFTLSRPFISADMGVNIPASKTLFEWIDSKYGGLEAVHAEIIVAAERGLDQTAFEDRILHPILDFLNRLFTAYQRDFITAITNNPPSIRSLEATGFSLPKIAAMGHLFPIKNTSALIPPYLLTDQSAPFFLPDADEAFNAGAFLLFQQPTERLVELNLLLRLTERGYPIFYQVQTATEMMTSERREFTVAGKKQNFTVPKNTEGRYVTLRVSAPKAASPSAKGVRESEVAKMTMLYPPEALADVKLFERYFHFHLLSLKSRAYFLGLHERT